MGKSKKAYKFTKDAIVHEGEKIVLPAVCETDARALADVLKVLQRLLTYNTEETSAEFVFPEVYPWDGALTCAKHLDEFFGFTLQNMGTNIDVAISYDKTATVPWGTFEIPGMHDADVTFDSCNTDSGLAFVLHVNNIKRADLSRFEEFVVSLRRRMKVESIYRGEALTFKGTAQPKFIDVAGTRMPIFNVGIQEALEVTLYAPIRYAEEAAKHAVPAKRGILLDGGYGTGKTETARRAALECSTVGRTFVMAGEGESIAHAFQFAARYGPAMLFVEDVDRYASERTNELNELLNVLDGVNTKQSNVIIVMTTNHLDKVHPSLLREGRCDARVTLAKPDAEAVSRLITRYGGVVDEKACEVLANQSPAAVREAVERSKLAALSMSSGKSASVTKQAMRRAAYSVVAQQDVVYAKPETQLESFASTLGATMTEGIMERLGRQFDWDDESDEWYVDEHVGEAVAGELISLLDEPSPTGEQ